jgi:hypothetical protein
LEQARRKLGVILWRDSVIFGKNFSDGQILSAILLELRSKSSHLGRREQISITIATTGDFPIMRSNKPATNRASNLPSVV